MPFNSVVYVFEASELLYNDGANKTLLVKVILQDGKVMTVSVHSHPYPVPGWQLIECEKYLNFRNINRNSASSYVMDVSYKSKVCSATAATEFKIDMQKICHETEGQLLTLQQIEDSPLKRRVTVHAKVAETCEPIDGPARRRKIWLEEMGTSALPSKRKRTELTVWGEKADVPLNVGDPICAKGLEIRSWNHKKTLETTCSTSVEPYEETEMFQDVIIEGFDVVDWTIIVGGNEYQVPDDFRDVVFTQDGGITSEIWSTMAVANGRVIDIII